MFETILVPTDGSEHAAAAVDRALSLAAEHDATVHAVCVAETGPLGYLRLPGETESAEEAINAQARRVVGAVADRPAAGGLTVETAVLTGPPGTAILEYAGEVDADLIVMGSRGRGGVHRLAVGSVTDHVIRFGDLDVFVTTAHSS
ncbi:universal stress protein [Natronobiforma cellulositropha]|uniref:universal stress protein n=1 Tax=Natronobiforma cellulositropha TaxID=1679076 RepID=UPI0021D5CBF1|nr:universal stress protein [Natronobiforma cellulositropha]